MNKDISARQRVGGICAIASAVILVLVMILTQTFAMKGVSGNDVYETTVNSLAANPILNWLLILGGAFGLLLMFWTVEALDERVRSAHPNVSSNVVRFGYIHLVTYILYMLMPVAVLHDLANKDKNISEAMNVIHPIIEFSLVLSVLSCIFLSVWLFQTGYYILKTKTLSKGLGIFTLFVSCIVLGSAGYEALYGRGGAPGIILSIHTFVGAFVVWKIWVGIEMLRKPV